MQDNKRFKYMDFPHEEVTIGEFVLLNKSWIGLPYPMVRIDIP